MHHADSLLNRLETEDDWIDRPVGPQRVVDRRCPRDRRRPDFGEVAARPLFRTTVAGFAATL